MKKKLIYGGSLTLKMTLIFAIIASVSQAIAMEKPSWAQALWQSTKDKFISLSLVQKELHARKQYQDLHKEVKEIVKNGSTVQEVETKKLHEKHQQVLENFKKCMGMPELNWHIFHEKMALAKAKNPLFTPAIAHQEEQADAVSRLIRRTLKKRNLNPWAVTIEFSKEKTTAALQWYNPFKDRESSPTNALRLQLPLIGSREDLTFAINHEITHLQEQHGIECMFLKALNSHASDRFTTCIKPYMHHTEFEADALYALQNYKAAQHAKTALAHMFQESAFAYKDYQAHPSDASRFKEANRIADMLALEKEMRNKHKTQSKKTESNIQKIFDPAFNC